VLDQLIQEINKVDDALPPVHLWEPAYCGEIDIRIARDGRWFHEGLLIQRQSLVNLFSKVLRYDDDDRYYLVTPVEKMEIQVDDAPFITVMAECLNTEEEQKICLTTNTGYRYIVDRDHPVYVEFDENLNPSPYSIVRSNLKSLLSRSVYLSLIEWGVMSDENAQKSEFGIWSSGDFFVLGELDNE